MTVWVVRAPTSHRALRVRHGLRDEGGGQPLKTRGTRASSTTRVPNVCAPGPATVKSAAARRNNFPKGHGPLQGCRREEHGRPPDRPSHPRATPGHGQLTGSREPTIMCSLNTSGISMTRPLSALYLGPGRESPR